MKKRYLSFIGAMLCIASLSGCSLSGNEASQAAVFQEQPETVRMAGREEVQREISGDSESTSGTPIVYMTTDISPEGLMRIYEALGAELPEGNIAVKISTGENGSNYLRPELIGDQDAFLESMADAGKSVSDYMDGNMLYINVMNRLSVDCDCDGNPAEPDMHDIGIPASFDPVAVDQACIDLVYSAEDGASLIERIESRNGLLTLQHAEEIGLGSRSYELVDIDEAV